MKIFHPSEKITCAPNESIVALLGPVPRSAETAHLNWHQGALNALEYTGYDGNVLIPIPRGQLYYDMNEVVDENYLTAQMQWNGEMFKIVANAGTKGVFAFWIPRDNKHMLVVYTEKEFYELVPKYPENIVLGIPHAAVNVNDMKNFCVTNNLIVEHYLKPWALDIYKKYQNNGMNVVELNLCDIFYVMTLRLLFMNSLLYFAFKI